MQKQWCVQHPQPQLQVKLSNALNVHPIVAQLLLNRGIRDTEEAKQFLTTDLSSLEDPFLFKGMRRAVERIHQARSARERILIFGDYDVDGVTSATLLYQQLTQMGIEVINHIPHRIHDGYGLNMGIGKFAKKHRVDLIIAVDCGITAFAEVELINSLGIDIIIIDHHQIDGKLPHALAIINPQQKDCPYPFKHFASVGLIFKFIQAVSGKVDEEILDLVAIGTIADIVPLRGENRILVKAGLPKINKTKNVGLSALLNITKIKDKKMTPHHVGFILGPRINATGRMDSAHKSLDLFLSKNSQEAYALAELLEEFNTERQRLQKEVVQEAMEIVEQEINFKDHKVIVLSKEGWHKGVLGIVASRITEKYYRPAIVISIKDGIGTASARSIDGFHLHEALQSCADCLEAYGGHCGAAGLTIKEENIDPFKELINNIADRVLMTDSLIPSISIDCEIPLVDVNMDLCGIIESMEPFGEGNPEPTFCSRQLIVKSPPVVLSKDTLKFWVSDEKVTLSAVGFGMAKYKPMIRMGERIDLAYQVAIDDWKKEPMVQLKLKDVRLSEGRA